MEWASDQGCVAMTNGTLVDGLMILSSTIMENHPRVQIGPSKLGLLLLLDQMID
jgi:hypothetical protein